VANSRPRRGRATPRPPSRLAVQLRALSAEALRASRARPGRQPRRSCATSRRERAPAAPCVLSRRGALPPSPRTTCPRARPRGPRPRARLPGTVYREHLSSARPPSSAAAPRRRCARPCRARTPLFALGPSAALHLAPSPRPRTESLRHRGDVDAVMAGALPRTRATCRATDPRTSTRACPPRPASPATANLADRRRPSRASAGKWRQQRRPHRRRTWNPDVPLRHRPGHRPTGRPRRRPGVRPPRAATLPFSRPTQSLHPQARPAAGPPGASPRRGSTVTRRRLV